MSSPQLNNEPFHFYYKERKEKGHATQKKNIIRKKERQLRVKIERGGECVEAMMLNHFNQT